MASPKIPLLLFWQLFPLKVYCLLLDSCHGHPPSTRACEYMMRRGLHHHVILLRPSFLSLLFRKKGPGLCLGFKNSSNCHQENVRDRHNYFKEHPTILKGRSRYGFDYTHFDFHHTYEYDAPHSDTDLFIGEETFASSSRHYQTSARLSLNESRKHF
jgi:hypothetical protein